MANTFKINTKSSLVTDAVSSANTNILTAGGSATLQFTIPKQSLAITTADGSKKLYNGEHKLVFSRGNGNDISVTVTI